MPRFLIGAAIFLPYVAGGVLVGFGERQDDTGLSVIGLGLIAIGIVATFVLPSRAEAGLRRHLQRAAPTMGMFYMDDDPYGLAQLDFVFFKGHEGASSMVLEGEWSGLPLKAFAYRYLNRHVDAQGDSHASTVTLWCAFAQMSSPLPGELPAEIERVRGGSKDLTFEVAGPRVLCIAEGVVKPEDLPAVFDALKGFVDLIPADYGAPVQPTVHEVVLG